MTYHTFLEESFRSIREQAPQVCEIHKLQPWLLSIGEILLLLPRELQQYWGERYAILLVIKYGHIHLDIARVCIRHGLTEAEERWPKGVPR